MANKIKKYAQQFPGKRIVILTGLNHKYYLQDELLKMEKGKIKIIELDGN